MEKALIIGNNNPDSHILVNKLKKYFPYIAIKDICNCLDSSFISIRNHKPELLFVDLESLHNEGFKLFSYPYFHDFEIILISNTSEYAVEAVYYPVSGYLLRPLQDQAFVFAIENAKKNAASKLKANINQDVLLKGLKQLPLSNKIGIPSIEGLKYICTSDIIRCEGLQKCTRIVIRAQPDIISSYNIGEFKKMLIKDGFFLTHKSHLVNLWHILEYNKSGFVMMTDHSIVPVSIRKRKEFLQQLPHL